MSDNKNRLKVVTDGNIHNTKVIDGNGNTLDGVQAIRIDFKAGNKNATAILEIIDVEIQAKEIAR